MEHLKNNGFVTTVYWQCEAVEGDYFARKVGVCNWSEDTVVTPYVNLLPETVLEWCWKEKYNLGDENSLLVKETVETELLNTINKQKNPVKQSGVPW